MSELRHILGAEFTGWSPEGGQRQTDMSIMRDGGLGCRVLQVLWGTAGKYRGKRSILEQNCISQLLDLLRCAPHTPRG